VNQHRLFGTKIDRCKSDACSSVPSGGAIERATAGARGSNWHGAGRGRANLLLLRENPAKTIEAYDGIVKVILRGGA
jgi:hypothetical protein